MKKRIVIAAIALCVVVAALAILLIPKAVAPEKTAVAPVNEEKNFTSMASFGARDFDPDKMTLHVTLYEQDPNSTEELPTMHEVGEGTYPLSENLIFTDFDYKAFAPVEVPLGEMGSHLEKMMEITANYYSGLDTRIEVKSGEIVAITRSYRP